MSDVMLFSRDHIWVLLDGETAIVGITSQRLEKISEIDYIELPEEGENMDAGEPFGLIETDQEVIDLIAPLTGTVEEVNEDVIDDPNILLEDPVNEGWLVRITIEDQSEIEQLLSDDDYEAFLENAQEEE